MDINSQIQDAIVARLVDQVPAVNARVYKVVDAPFAPDTLPALVVTVGSENIEAFAGDIGFRLQKREIQIVIDAIENADAETSFVTVRELRKSIELALGDFENLALAYTGKGRHAIKSFSIFSVAPNGGATEEGRVEVQTCHVIATVYTTENNPDTFV